MTATFSIRRALLSVSDKSGLVELATVLVEYNVELVSTGGTARVLHEAGLPVRDIADLTGYPEMLDGRVKTLHPKVHGGLLFRRDDPAHLDTVAIQGIEPIDLVVVNLYPFAKTIALPGVSRSEAIEQIDIGGPAMLRSAAKNQDSVAVLCAPEQYPDFLNELKNNKGAITVATARRLAVAVFAETSRYDRMIADYLAGNVESPSKVPMDLNGDDRLFPPTVTRVYERHSVLRYGENPHQAAAFYRDSEGQLRGLPSLSTAIIRHGKELSYNNLLDLDAALAMIVDLDDPGVVIIKHNNPCGAALGASLDEAFQRAHETDTISAFGSIVGCNRPVDLATAMAMTEPGQFIEAVLAPTFTDDAFAVLTTRPTWKNSVRLVELGSQRMVDRKWFGTEQVPQSYRSIAGGLLVQSSDLVIDSLTDSMCVSEKKPTSEQLADLQFAWAMVKHVKSNGIVLAKGRQLVGLGVGQMSRVDSTRIAIEKAGPRSVGSVLASDAFFPFRDNVDAAAQAGVTALVQPGGSKRDAETIAAANEHGLVMLFTGRRHFKH